MLELIKSDNKVDLRELFNTLEISGRFRDWVKNTVMKYEFEEGKDYQKINTVVGKTVQYDYSISVDMAKELCMIAKSPKGKIIRNYFIDAEKRNKMHEDYLKLLTANPSNTVCITDVCCKLKELYPQQANEYLLSLGLIEKRASGYYPSFEMINSNMAISASAVNPNSNRVENYVRYTPKGVEYLLKVLSVL